MSKGTLEVLPGPELPEFINNFFNASLFSRRSVSSILVTAPFEVDFVDLKAAMRSLYGVANAEPSSPGVDAPSSSNGNTESPSRGAGDRDEGLSSGADGMPI